MKQVLATIAKVGVKGLAHITGGGLLENIPRVLPQGVAARLDARRWPRPAIFDWLQQEGGVEEAEMQRTFNCGIGMVVVVPNAEARPAIDAFAAHGVEAFHVGSIVERQGSGPQALVA